MRRTDVCDPDSIATPCEELVNPRYVNWSDSGTVATIRHDAPLLNVSTKSHPEFVCASVTAAPGEGLATTAAPASPTPGTVPPRKNVEPPVFEKYARTAGGPL
jgi:hypothetical protein